MSADMPENPIFPNDPTEVANMAADGGVARAEISVTRDWENSGGVTDEMRTRASQMRTEIDPATNREKYTESQIRDAILGGDKNVESGEGVKSEDKTEKKPPQENKDSRVWVARLSADGKRKTWLRVDSDQVDSGTDEIGVFEPGKEPRDGEDAGVVVEVPEPTPPTPEPIPPVPPTPEPEPPTPEPDPIEEEGEESALTERLRADEAFRNNCVRFLGEYSGEGDVSGPGAGAFKREIAGLVGVDLGTLGGDRQSEWRALQNAYFTEILGGPDSKSRRFRISCQRTGRKEDALRKLLDDNLAYPNSIVGDEITDAEVVSGIGIKSKAERRLMDWIAGIEVTREEDKSDYGVVVKLFKTRYILDRVNLSEDEIQKMDLKTETLRVVQAVEKLHNWTKALESASSFEKLNTTELSGIDEALKTVFEIGGGRMMAGVMETYIGEMTRAAMTDETIGVDIDNSNVRNRVLARMDSRVFKTDEEKVLFATIARDLIRVTGMDAQFFMPRNGIEDKDKPLKLVKGGSFLAGAINFEEKTKNKYAEDKAVLVNGLDFGLVPFLRKIRKESNSRCEDLSAVDILDAFRTKFAGTEYSAWIGSFEGIVGAQKVEDDFIRNPSLDTFLQKMPGAYSYLKDKAKPYLRVRFKACLKQLIANNDFSEHSLKEVLESKMNKDRRFDGLGIFEKVEEAKTFFRDMDLSVGFSGSQDRISFDKGYNSQVETIRRQNEMILRPFRSLKKWFLEKIKR